MNKLFEFVDKVYVINLIDRKDRKDKMIKMFVEMGLSEYILNNKIEFIEAVKLPGFTEDVLKHFTGLMPYTNYGLCMCTFEHFRAMKRALYHNYENVLILEDDVRFIKDIDLLNKAINNLPEDYDILHLEGFYWPTSEDEWAYCAGLLSDNKKETKWIESEKLRMYDCGVLLFSKKGLQHTVELQEKDYQASDIRTFYMTENCYFYNYPLAIQCTDYSDILNKEAKKENFVDAENTINVYQSKVRKEEYYD